MKIKFFVGIGAIATVALSGAQTPQLDVVGQVSDFRGAKVSTRPNVAGSYVVPTVKQPVHNGDGVRTDRRGFAQITFSDKSALRLSELTELVVQDSISMRRMQLSKGAIWTRVTRGANTSVQTPVATATVRGTEFLIDDKGNLAVREGVVELEAGGFTIEVGAGEIGGVGEDGRPFKKNTVFSTDPEVSVEVVGVPAAWWRALRSGAHVRSNDEFLALLLVPLLFVGGSSASRSPDPVPEPATLIVLTVGAGAVAARRMRRG